MFRLVAPFNSPETTIVLPHPLFGDSETLRGSLITKRAIDGTIYTYVKKKEKTKTYLWDFNVTLHKALELFEFYKAYNSCKIIVYWNDKRYVGYFKNNPLEENVFAAALNSPGNEFVKATIELEESN